MKKEEIELMISQKLSKIEEESPEDYDAIKKIINLLDDKNIENKESDFNDNK